MEHKSYLCPCADRKFRSIMDTAYFHPSRDEAYPYQGVKRIARCAMELLWRTEEITVCGFVFRKPMIRRLLMEEMMPQDLDLALYIFSQGDGIKSVVVLALDIFIAMLMREALALAQFERDFGSEGILVEATEEVISDEV